MALSPDPCKNQLSAALPSHEWPRWLSRLEAVDLPLGHASHEAGNTLGQAYFPTTAIVALMYVMESGASVEIAVVGNEGSVGISLLMGSESTPSRAVVLSAGRGFRLSPNAFKDEFRSDAASVQTRATRPDRSVAR